MKGWCTRPSHSWYRNVKKSRQRRQTHSNKFWGKIGPFSYMTNFTHFSPPPPKKRIKKHKKHITLLFIMLYVHFTSNYQVYAFQNNVNTTILFTKPFVILVLLEDSNSLYKSHLIRRKELGFFFFDIWKAIIGYNIQQWKTLKSSTYTFSKIYYPFKISWKHSCEQTDCTSPLRHQIINNSSLSAWAK